MYKNQNLNNRSEIIIKRDLEKGGKRRKREEGKTSRTVKNSTYTIINAAMTVDGKIASISGDSAISSRDDLIRVHRLRAAVDAIMIGISTAIADDPLLTVRLPEIKKPKNPVRIVIDSAGRIPINSRILQTANSIKTIVAVSRRAAATRIKEIKKCGADVIVCGDKTVDLQRLFSKLWSIGIKRVMVEGGGEINWSLVRLRIADEIIITISPRIVGGRAAITLVEGEGFKRIDKAAKLRLIKITRKRNGEVILHYRFS